MNLARCAPPTLTSRRISTYTITGFAGYAVANVVAAVLASDWSLTLSERLIAFFAPPFAFIIVVTIATAIAGQERIVFYQTTVAGIAAVVLTGWFAGARVERLLDVTTIGIGVFLVFGRLGCHAVACCHGTLGHGVTYGRHHVAAGFWNRWSGRSLWPVQLVEAAASAVLVVLALSCSTAPGTAALIYSVGYCCVRFGLELVRGDVLRPYALGLSEAQWVSLCTALACLAWRPGLMTIIVASTLLTAAIVLVALRNQRAVTSPPHLRELDGVLAAAHDGKRHSTSQGVAVSRNVLPDGRVDWILSAPGLTETTARKLAHLMWASWELVPARTPEMVHVLTRDGA
jgi:hypothetical protein